MNLVLDINTIPSDYKTGKTTKEIIATYKKDFNIDVEIIPIDLSKENIGDGALQYPVYFEEIKPD